MPTPLCENARIRRRFRVMDESMTSAAASETHSVRPFASRFLQTRHDFSRQRRLFRGLPLRVAPARQNLPKIYAILRTNGLTDNFAEPIGCGRRRAQPHPVVVNNRLVSCSKFRSPISRPRQRTACFSSLKTPCIRLFKLAVRPSLSIKQRLRPPLGQSG
jgi:hypothetical protein